jgi:endoglucanase
MGQRLNSLSTRFRILLIGLLAGLLGSCLLVALVPAAQAAGGWIAFSQSSYSANEDQGSLTITLVRSDTSGSEQIRYGLKLAHPEEDSAFIQKIPNTYATFAPGQATLSIQVPITDRGANSPTLQETAYIFGSDPAQLATPTGHVLPHGPVNATINIHLNDPLQARNSANPLGLATVPADGNLIAGAPLYVPGTESPAGEAERTVAAKKPSWARDLSVIANAPGSHRIYFWNERHPGLATARYLANAEVRQPGSTVELTTYSLVHGACASGGHWSDSPATVARYHHWINGLAQGIGNYHVLLFFEIDSLITTPCLSKSGLHVRLVDELDWAIHRLEQDPHLVLYLDAGAADALSWRVDAHQLRTAGVKDAQGFFLNATHFDWTTHELWYGQKVARALGGVHFIINTGGNGQGPLVPKDRVKHGNEELCNPPGRGLGPETTDTGYRWADALLWFDNPGGSAGCGKGAPPIAVFWPAYAVGLVKRMTDRITGPSYPLIHQTPTQPTSDLKLISQLSW